MLDKIKGRINLFASFWYFGFYIFLFNEPIFWHFFGSYEFGVWGVPGQIDRSIISYISDFDEMLSIGKSGAPNHAVQVLAQLEERFCLKPLDETTHIDYITAKCTGVLIGPIHAMSYRSAPYHPSYNR